MKLVEHFAGKLLKRLKNKLFVTRFKNPKGFVAKAKYCLIFATS